MSEIDEPEIKSRTWEKIKDFLKKTMEKFTD